ncbi:hypothetical protein POM88_012230 [Heracleum sosnowskyi]|uniref:Uncharacterized protein n=1 Tax=Heracleum sosnowskyi TaxID=360622 RepID=A0AAD8IW22_9APIA|nr:hypothetical protein POM88_012230 [Heracleum sosnowskyi]
MLPNAFDYLTSESLESSLWRKFMFTGYVAMMSSIETLMTEFQAAAIFYTRLHFKTKTHIILDEEKVGNDGHNGHVQWPSQDYHLEKCRLPFRYSASPDFDCNTVN